MKDLTFGGIKVTWENHWGFLTGRNNEFSNNHIHHVVTDSDDAGAITFWGTGRGNVIKSNLIHDLNFSVDNGLGQGIYLDEAADGTTIDSNVVYGLSGKIVQGIFAKGIGTKVFRNVLVLQDDKHTGIRSQEMAGERTDHHVYRKNAIIFRDKAGALFNFSNWSDTRLDESDENLFYAQTGAPIVRLAGTVYSLQQWRDFPQGGDRRSTLADPQFTHPSANDFTFGSNSPLTALGIPSLSRSEVGLPPDYSL
jgi:hypothetical protein